MKKSNFRAKYTNLFNGQSFMAEVGQLEALMQWLSDPMSVLLSDPEYFKNLLDEYLCKGTHSNHKLVLTAQGIIAAYQVNQKGPEYQNGQENFKYFNKIFLRIAYIGHLDREFLCASLSCLARFIDYEEVVDRLYHKYQDGLLKIDKDDLKYLKMKKVVGRLYMGDLVADLFKEIGVKSKRCPGLDEMPRIINIFLEEFNACLGNINDWSGKNGVADPIQKAYKLYKNSAVQHITCNNDVAFHLIMCSPNALSLNDLVRAWKHLFDISLKVGLQHHYKNSDNLSLALLRSITKRKSSHKIIFKEIELSVMHNMLCEKDNARDKLFILKTLNAILLQMDVIDKNIVIKIFRTMLDIMFKESVNGRNSSNKRINKESLKTLKVLMKHVDKDHWLLGEMYCCLTMFMNEDQVDLTSSSSSNMTLLCKYLADNQLYKALNKVLIVLISKEEFAIIAHVMGKVPVINSEFCKSVISKIGNYQNMIGKSVGKSKNYVFAYVSSVSVGWCEINNKYFDGLMDIIIAAMADLNYTNRTGIFVLFSNLIHSYSYHENFKRDKLCDTFLDFCENAVEDKEVLLFVKFLADAGCDVVEILDFSIDERLFILSQIANHLNKTTNKLVIKKICNALDLIFDREKVITRKVVVEVKHIAKPENIQKLICHPEVKGGFIDDMMKVINDKEEDYIVPVIQLFLKRSKQLGLGKIHFGRIRDKLLSMIYVESARENPEFFELLIFGIQTYPEHYLEDSTLKTICTELVNINSEDSIHALLTLISFLDSKQLSKLHRKLPKKISEHMKYLFEELLPVFKEHFNLTEQNETIFEQIVSRFRGNSN